MLDIIIPCHNSHKTIDRCIGSILAQTSSDICNVTLVNDGGKDYKEVIERYSPVLKIREIGYEENKGPGCARNFGILNTDKPFLMFMDSDDVLLNPLGIATVTNLFRNPNIVMLICGIRAENADGSTRVMLGNRNYLHGKLYRRSYLQKHEILFNNSSCCEDGSFNYLCLDIMDDITEQAQSINFELYGWLYNRSSLGRTNVELWEYCKVPQGVLENNLFLFDELEKRGINNQKVLKEKIVAMLHCLISWLYNTNNYPQYKKENDFCLASYYTNIYSKVEDQIDDALFERVYDEYRVKGDKETNLKLLRGILTKLRTAIGNK